MRILINCLPSFSEALVDHIDERLRSQDLPVSPVILRVHHTDSEQVTLTGWRREKGVITHSFPVRFVLDPAYRQELDRAVEVFMLCLNSAAA